MAYVFIFSLICFLLATLGASVVFFVKNLNEKIEAILNAFASGVMMSSCIFSLIIPALNYCAQLNMAEYVILPCCFIIGGVIFIFLDVITKRKSLNKNINTSAMIIGLGLHNIPEGMCVGLAFASASVIGTEAAFTSAVMIAIGIGIQNIPEGSAVAFPLYGNGVKKTKSFLISVFVQFIELPAAIIAYLIGTHFISIFPFVLSFSSALVMLIVMCDIFPEALSKSRGISFLSMLIGFILMMTLDLLLS